MRIGLNCVYFDSIYTMIIMSSIMEKGDLVIAISHLGETEEIIKTVELAKENGASIISITENKESELKEISDINLSYISGEMVL